jgi:hypothetical protein
MSDALKSICILLAILIITPVSLNGKTITPKRDASKNPLRFKPPLTPKIDAWKSPLRFNSPMTPKVEAWTSSLRLNPLTPFSFGGGASFAYYQYYDWIQEACIYKKIPNCNAYCSDEYVWGGRYSSGANNGCGVYWLYVKNWMQVGSIRACTPLSGVLINVMAPGTCRDESQQLTAQLCSDFSLSWNSSGSTCDSPSTAQSCYNLGLNWNSYGLICSEDPPPCPEQQYTCPEIWQYWDEWQCGCAGSPPSPVLVDVLGDGFNLTDAQNGVNFDISNRGSTLQISWTGIGSDDAWLALDRNGNAVIDNGSELFGNVTPQPVPPTGHEKNGFIALAEYDKTANGGNNDGKIQQTDAIFSSLRLWQDVNHNGISEAAELHTLAELGIATLELDYKQSKRTDAYGNQFRYRAKVTDIHGAQVGRWAWDVFLRSF